MGAVVAQDFQGLISGPCNNLQFGIGFNGQTQVRQCPVNASHDGSFSQTRANVIGNLLRRHGTVKLPRRSVG